MSGAISIPFAFFGLYLQNAQTRATFMALAYLSIWALVVKKGINHKRELTVLDSRIKISEAEKTPLIDEISDLKSQLDESKKRKKYRTDLSAYLNQLELRIVAIAQMQSWQYVRSIDDRPEEIRVAELLSLEEQKRLNDKVSLEIIMKIATYLETIEEGKGQRFTSFIGLVPYDRREGTSIEAVWFNKQALMLEHLQHRAKNLIEIIKELGC